MSNYAPDPKKIPMYEQLNTFGPFDDGLATAIDNVTQNMKVQGANQDDMIALNIINKAIYRDGNPMPSTAVIGVGSVTDSGVGVNIFTPAKGTVWAIQSGSAVVTGRSGNVIHELYWIDNTSSREILWYYNQSANDNQIFSDDSNWLGDKYIDSNITLKYEATGTYTESVISILLYRIR
tara:strand:+ start:1056 stop:1592 length:537 start_codon:yes stop_codon:yes gene_type:complete